MKEKDQRWAIFWCSILHPILYGDIGEKDCARFLRTLSEQSLLLPNGKSKKPSLSTLKRKLKQFQSSGFESLARKSRSDKGLPRNVSASVIDTAVEVKRDQAKRSAHAINSFIKQRHGVVVPRSTLYRHLKQRGATRIKLGIVQTKVRCRWTREKSNDLWIGDFSDGPYTMLENHHVAQTHLSLFIDCHSRFVVEGRYYLRQSLDILIDSLLRAWTVQGLPNDLYLDNAKLYHSNALKAACYALHIKLIHRTPRDPSPGGLVERIFGTNQGQFETEVRAGDILPLDQLNRSFQAWLHDYHHRVHSETQHTPYELYQDRIKRQVDMGYAIKFFMEKGSRVVHQDFSDVSINGQFYSVPPQLRGDKVIVRYDPFGPMDKVLIYSTNDEFLATAKLYHRELNNSAAPPAPAQGKPKYNYLDLLLAQHEQYLNQQASTIDFVKLSQQKRWPFVAMLNTLAGLFGRSQGTSAFSSSELDTLKNLYDQFPLLNHAMLTSAFEHAEVTNIPHLVLQLQLLKDIENK